MLNHTRRSETRSTPAQAPRGLRVLKFGGTSVATLEGWRCVAEVVGRHRSEGAAVVVVCSALAGVTNALTRLVTAARQRRETGALLDELTQRHHALGRQLDVDTGSVLGPELDALRAVLAAPGKMTPLRKARILATGELLSTRLGDAYLRHRGVPSRWIDARTILRRSPDSRSTSVLSAQCDTRPQPTTADAVRDAGVVITQGFIARNRSGDTILLGRGGSDTSAAYLATILGAERVEIWTDVPGVFTANPSQVPEARLVPQMGYVEASALSALGAGVLHPRCLQVVHEHDLPLWVGWTEEPRIRGTRVNGASQGPAGVCATTSRESLALLVLRRPHRWQPVGFMADVARCFREHGLSIDLVSSSASEIRVTLDLNAVPEGATRVEPLLTSLRRVADVEVVRPVGSVSVVGQQLSSHLHRLAAVADCLHGEAIHMVTHAGNDASVSYVVNRSSAAPLIQRLHATLFSQDGSRSGFGPTWAQLNATRA